MLIIGCDFHTRYQQIAMLDEATGEVVERRLDHLNGEAEAFYRSLPQLWVGHAAEIRARAVRQQKTDTRDARHLLELLLSNRFPRIWVPSPEERDVRQLLRHRFQLVGFRTSVKNQLHALAMGQGVCRRKKLWSAQGRQELEQLPLDPWAHRRRQELLEIHDRLQATIQELDLAVKQEAQNRAAALRLMQQPGVGPVTALAFVLTIGPVERFRKSKQVVSYL